MNRRRPLLPIDYQPQGLDIEPQQAALPTMQMPAMPPPMQFAPMQPDDSMSQLAQMGTQRALARFLTEEEDEPNGFRPKKKPTASPADALAAFKAGGSL